MALIGCDKQWSPPIDVSRFHVCAFLQKEPNSSGMTNMRGGREWCVSPVALRLYISAILYQ